MNPFIILTIMMIIKILAMLILQLYFLLETITLKLLAFPKWEGDMVITRGAIRERGLGSRKVIF